MKIYGNKLGKVFLMSVFTIFFFGATVRSYAQEMCILDETYTMTVNEHGFHYFPVNPMFPDNWVMPFNFYDGNFYIKYEILDYPSKTPFGLSLGIWSDIEYDDAGGIKQWRESCSPQLAISGRGVFQNVSSPTNWWKRNLPIDYTRMKDVRSFFIVYWCSNFLNLSDWVPANESCWSQRDLLMPMSMHITIVAVAKGYKFSGWK